MLRESSFRLFIALLLAIQTLCWSLTLLDLLSPGKPLSLLRTANDLLSQFFSRRYYASAMIPYRDARLRV